MENVSSTQVIFENGVTFERDKNGLWHYKTQNRQGHSKPVEISEIKHKYNIRPIIESMTYSNLLPRTYIKSIQREDIYLDSILTQVIPKSLEKDPFISSLFDIKYIVGAVIYHCKQLAEIYSSICYLGTRVVDISHTDSDKFVFGNFSEPHYEFDALITAARRAYDTTRYILWNVFGPGKGSIPASFPKVISHCTKIPPSLITRLNNSWEDYGRKMTDYRDCIQHYSPLSRGITSINMLRLDEFVWSMSIYIPDNPEVRSLEKFRISKKIDALTYGWELTNEITEIAVEIVNAVEKFVN
ncbi:MAG TPA: hypothetical protein PLE10_01630 [Brevefilum sp.]|nr:hypothetical protein [Brevefilum sp.]HPL69089.1 hypothetical protein [Brevefilum sp.]